MVTDPLSRYTSPAGKEFTLAAGRFAGINPSSHVLDMGCGYGEGACNLAYEMRCRIVACDNNSENIEIARENAIRRGVSHLITFECKNILETDYSETPFDLILAEGGVLSYISRLKGLTLACKWLVPRGWFAFSDLIILDQKAPKEILDIYKHDYYCYETEDSYRHLIAKTELEIHFMCLVPLSGWDNYYAHLARKLEETEGIFADYNVKMAFHKEIDTFYRFEAYKYLGYLFCVTRKKS